MASFGFSNDRLSKDLGVLFKGDLVLCYLLVSLLIGEATYNCFLFNLSFLINGECLSEEEDWFLSSE